MTGEPPTPRRWVWFTRIGVVVGTFALVALIVACVGLALGRDHEARVEVDLAAPLDAVWMRVRTFETQNEWRDRVTQTVRLQDHADQPVYRESAEYGDLIYLVETDEPPSQGSARLVTRVIANRNFGGTWTYEFESRDAGCHLRITEAGEIYNPVFRVIARYIYGYDTTLNEYAAQLEASFER